MPEAALSALSARRLGSLPVLGAGLLVSAGLAALAGVLTWTSVTSTSGGPSAHLTGFTVTRAPLLMVAVAVLALLVARLGNRTVRTVLAVVVVLLGVGIVVVALSTHPSAASLAVLHPELLARFTGSVHASSGPGRWIAMLAGVVLAGTGAAAVRGVRGWRPPAARYRRDPAPRADPWKQLDAGDDPTRE